MQSLTTTENRQVGFVQINNMQEAYQFAEMIASTDFAPKAFRGKPAEVAIAMQFGMELGLPPMKALQGTAVVNGTPKLWGPTALAVLMSHPAFEDLIEHERSVERAIIEMRRKGRSPITREFSINEAKQAGLLGKDVWQKYAADMLWWKAVHRCASALFPDVAAGIADMSPAEITERDVSGHAETSGPAPAKSQKEKLSEKLGKPVESETQESAAPAPEWQAKIKAVLDSAEYEEDIKRGGSLAKELAKIRRPLTDDQKSVVDAMIVARRKELPGMPQAASEVEAAAEPESTYSTPAFDLRSGAPVDEQDIDAIQTIMERIANLCEEGHANSLVEAKRLAERLPKGDYYDTALEEIEGASA